MTIEQINKICRNTFISHLEIEFLDFGEDFVLAKMPVNQKKFQPIGVLHGGASLALAETVAGAGSMLIVDNNKYNVFGLQVNGNHVATVSSGEVFARAEIIHKGQSTHVWDVKITDSQDKLISVSRVTNILKEK
ncbi:MAG: hotdog fold thioesterase [Bacteroidales bacterium]|nr:hotdog fold thioesterase [Bacteroidales bacterium]MBN2819805.1 hotdog fold thioesterase [Bacteroidales bacterium]